MTCMLTGRPSGDRPVGTAHAGRPARLAGSESTHQSSKNGSTGTPSMWLGPLTSVPNAGTGMVGVSSTSRLDDLATACLEAGMSEQRALGGEPLRERDVVPQLGRVRRVGVLLLDVGAGGG